MAERVIFATKAAASDNTQAASEYLVNCYADPQPEGARSPLVLRPVTALRERVSATKETSEIILTGVSYPISTIGAAFFLSAYTSNTGRLYRYNSGNTVTALATTTLTPDKRSTMAAMPGYIGVVNNGVYNLYDIVANTWSTPGSGALNSGGITSITTLSDYMIMSGEIPGVQGARFVEWTELADPTTRNALHFRAKSGGADPVRMVAASQGRLYVLGAETTEVWFVTGNAGADAFDRIPGAIYNVGCIGNNLAVDAFNRLYVVTNDYKVVEWSGGNYRIVSNKFVETSIRLAYNTGGELGVQTIYPMEDKGRQILCVKLTASITLCYDVETNLWYTRGDDADFGSSFLPDYAVRAYNSWYLAGIDGANRKFWEMDPGYSIKASQFGAFSRPIKLDRTFVASYLEFMVKSSGSGTFDLRLSSNGGPYGTAYQRPLSSSNSDRFKPFRSLGSFKQMTAQFVVNTTGGADVQVDAVALLGIK